MSKKSKKSNREKRLQRKQALKAANKARYAELKRIGQNSKSKRFQKNAKRRGIKTIDHRDGFCGNPACKKCFSSLHSKAA
jgi:hypothetical protein